MKMVKYYLTGAIATALFAWFFPYWPVAVLFAWTSFSLACVSVAYIFEYPSLFRKRHDGTIPLYIRWIFIPFLLGTGAYNTWARSNDKVPAIQKIEDNLLLACRLFGHDVENLKKQGVGAVLDVTAEFDGLDWSAYQYDIAYLNIPVLDHTSPTVAQLNTAINFIDQHRKRGTGVVVHCALGRGRSVLTVAAYLLATSPTLSVEEAMNKIQSIRQTARLNKKQMKALRAIQQGGLLKLTRSLHLIANPVSGGGKWTEEKDDILAMLNPHFRVTIHETTPQTDAKALAIQAAEAGAETLVACGGDGTVSEVAAVCVAHKTVLGVIPLGTANALSQVLHGYISKIMPVQTACDIIIKGHTVDMDTTRCNDDMMLLVAAVGFEQEMIAEADREEKNSGGQFAYLKGLWNAISANNNMTLNVQFNDEAAIEIETPSFVIANAAPITTALAQGGDLPDITDGLMDITWLLPQPSGETQLLSLAELVFTNKASKQQSDTIRHQQVRTVHIELPGKTPYAIDGEIKEDESLTITTVPASLSVLTSSEQEHTGRRDV